MLFWFGYANRYVVFLYDHDMGPRVPDTSPFSPVTRSRYWMTGLVVGGLVMALTTAASGVLGRRTAPLPWRRVWLLAALPIVVGIVWITMTLNHPTLPLDLALLVAGVTLLGLALALQPAAVAARRHAELLLLAGDGLCLALWLVTLPGLAYVPYWLRSGGRLWLALLVIPPVVGLVGLGLLTGIRWFLKRLASTFEELVLAALCAAYLLLPLVHHVLGTDGRFYISDMDNFFSRNPLVQLVTWGAAAALAWTVARLRASMRGRFVQSGKSV
jgi:hypothetical protein